MISDRVDKTGYVNLEKHKWGCVSGGSGGPPSLRSLETPTPMPTSSTPFFSPEYPLSNTTNLRGQTTQRSKSRVEAMLERALIQPQQCSVDPLYNAQNWGIPIWAIDKFQAWLDKIYASAKDTNHLKQLRHSHQQSASKDIKVKHLKGHYLKFESFQRDSRPVFVELPVWPTLNFHGDPGSCPFATKRREKLEKLEKEVKENREGIRAINQGEKKEMTRRPRTTARTRRTDHLASGYCEICRIRYRDLTKHVQSDQHLSFVRNDDNFLSLDKLINAGANVEAFLELNRGKNIEKDCNLFSNGDRNLHDTVLPEGKVNRNAKSLEGFDVGDIKMVQRNGARRNLSLKLNSSHNLRTRARHESGHLLRSKGSPWHEADKAEKFYDEFEGFTIKKRAKGTIWIEEDGPGDKYIEEDELKESKQNEYKVKTFSTELEEKCCENEKNCGMCNNKLKDTSNQDVHRTINCNNEENSIKSDIERIKQEQTSIKDKNHDQINGSVKNVCNENLLSTNDNSRTESCKVSSGNETLKELTCKFQLETTPCSAKRLSEHSSTTADTICNGHTVKDEQKIAKTLNGTEKDELTKELKSKYYKSSRRGSRSVRGRHRLSVEERLIEDNRAYYKVEVLGSKLRSSVLSNNNSQCTVQRDGDCEEKKEVPSSEKPVVVRFKRVRKSELSLLSDEAESFMFRELKRDDSSETSDGEQSSILPRDTESECNDTGNSISSSFLSSSSPVKSETIEDDSQDSLNLGRARKRRRTQAEALIKDNVDYYKFETPGSRLRYQAPLTGIKESSTIENPEKIEEEKVIENSVETGKVYPSKPSPEVEKMQFSFEGIPKSEPWYQTYQRQDMGAEFWHYFSEGDSQKPFLLPYEIENFHEISIKNQNRTESKRKGRGRSVGCIGRSPRKSPRCHASTLAIMSTIIRKREQQQQQQSSNLCTMDECQSVRSQVNTPRPDHKTDQSKSDAHEDLKEIVKSIDEMLNANDNFELMESFKLDTIQIESIVCEPNVPRGPPSNLFELLESSHDLVNCLENSSCASSECGEGSVELPLKRRKKRKNRTGWPGIKMKRRLQSKPLADINCDRENLAQKSIEHNEKDCDVQVTNISSRLTEEDNIKIDASVTSSIAQDEQSLGFSQRKDDGRLFEMYSSSISSNTRHDENEKKDVSIAVSDNSILHTTNAESCTGSLTPDICHETDRNFILNKDYGFRKNLPEIEEMSENDPGNDENHENVFRKDVHSISERRFISNATIKKRQRDNNASSETCESRVELDNHEILCGKEAEATIVSRKHHNTNGLSRKRQRKNHSENSDSEIEQHRHHHHHHYHHHHHNNVYKRNRVTSRKRIYARRRARKNNISSNAVFEDENCKKDSYLSITCKKSQNIRGTKRRADTMSSETQESEVDCTLSGRVTPAIIATAELGERRSSIEFQPVVRMMKIDDKVEMDHSILSVTIANNRQLRSSSSPRSNTQPPKKRLKTNRGQFGRWLKSS